MQGNPLVVLLQWTGICASGGQCDVEGRLERGGSLRSFTNWLPIFESHFRSYDVLSYCKTYNFAPYITSNFPRANFHTYDTHPNFIPNHRPAIYAVGVQIPLRLSAHPLNAVAGTVIKRKGPSKKAGLQSQLLGQFRITRD